MNNKNHGFTIIELLIATTVFSLVLLLLSVSVIQISRAYYKGLTNSRTQETARAILQDVSQTIQFNKGGLTKNSTFTCFGDRRWSHDLTLANKVLEDGSVPGLIADKQGICPAAPPPNPADPNYAELLIPGARLGKFNVDSLGNNLFQITVRVVYGDDDLLVDNDGVPGPDSPGSCKTQQAGTQFCAVSELSTIVRQRIP